MYFSITSIVFALLASSALSSARPTSDVNDLELRSGGDSVTDVDALFSRHIEEATALFARDLEAALLERRGGAISSLTNKKKRRQNKRKGKGKQSQGGGSSSRKAEGEHRYIAHGASEDYFGNWQLTTQGVDNPAAGRGRY